MSLTSPKDLNTKKFFVRKVKHLNYSNVLVKEIKEISKKVMSLSREELINEYAKHQTKLVKVEPYYSGKYLIKTEVHEAVEKGFISPSMFIKYRSCARELVIEIIESKKLGGVLVTTDQLKSLLKGVLLHKLYFSKYALGTTEVKVVSEKHKILGYVDEVQKFGSKYNLIELKSSFNFDIVGVGLQVMSYMYAFCDSENVHQNNVEGYIISPVGTYKVYFNEEVFAEYMNRVRTVVSIALRNDVSKLPPRHPQKSRCSSCPYRDKCFNLPDTIRTYDKFFKLMNFRKLAKSKSITLDMFRKQ